MTLGKILRGLRKDDGARQKDLAKYLGVSVSTISHYEAETHLPDVFTLVKISDYFGVSTDFLLGRTRLRMDFGTFQRLIRLSDGTTISMDRILALFLKLSDESQVDIVKIMRLYHLGDKIRHDELQRTNDAGEEKTECKK